MSTTNRPVGNIYRIGRKLAGFTQEQAAEKLGVSTRSLQEYERERLPDEEPTCVSSSMAAKMAKAYNMRILGLWHLKYFDPCGEFMPDVIEPSTCGDMGFLVHLSHEGTHKALGMASELLQDGKITPDEYGDAHQLARELKVISGRCLSSATFIETEYPVGTD